jgi:large subunit ribosomal protein L28
MAAVCDICGKKPSFGMSVSHSHRLHVCTSCLRAGKVTKPVRRTPAASAS